MKKFQCGEVQFQALFDADPLGTLSIQYILNNKENLVCYTDDSTHPSGILIENGYLHYAYAKTPAFIERIVQHFSQPGEYGFAGIPRKIATALKHTYEEEWGNPCTAYALSKEDYHPERQVHPTKPLRLEDAELVDRYYPYSGDHSLKMIREDISLRPSAAVFIDENPVSWALQHPDGTIGMMHTLEEHRHKGYARDTTFGIVEALLAQGEIPVVQIVDTNTASKQLAKSCGFKSFGTADWFGIIVK